MGSREKDNSGLFSLVTTLEKKQPSYVMYHRTSCLRNRLEGRQTLLHMHIRTDVYTHFSLLKFFIKSALYQNELSFKQGLGEKEPSKTFLNPANALEVN